MRGVRAAATRIVGAGLLGPGLVTLLAFAPSVGFAVAALAYMLAVVIASAVGGFRAGLLATVASFIGLNLFFTQPRHTFDIEKPDDLLALAVFAVAASIVGSVLANALAQRARAERREEEARLLHHVALRLLTGEGIEDVLHRFATAITELFGLGRCEVRATSLIAPVVARSDEPGGEGRAESVPMRVDDREVGSITAVPRAGRTLANEERQVVEMFAGQMALALKGLELASEVDRAEQEAEVSRARSALFSSVTHDLRTPLASILAAATSLLDRQATFGEEDRRDLVDTIRHEAERLNRLVGNVLQLSRMRAGGLVSARSPGSIEEVVEETLSRLRHILAEHRVEVDLPDDLPEIPMDVVQMDQALTNLVENAARMSPPGTVIRVAARSTPSGVEVSVADGGPGIPEEERESVFRPFVRGAGARGPGSGLGLAIAKAMVEAHGGRIWIEETPGGGATVTFELPREISAETPVTTDRP